MKLKEYLEESGITAAKLAKRLDVPPNLIYNILDGREPKVGLAVKIQKYTKGQVTCEDLVPESPKSEANTPASSEEDLDLDKT